MSYTKLHKEILYSTIWMEPSHVRIVWITMLALRDERNEIQASVPGLADAAKVSREQCEQALDLFMSPDPDSRSQEFEGRRIEKCEGGWRLLNGDRFRQRQSSEERREYMREYMRKKREKERQNEINPYVNSNVSNVKNVKTVEKSKVKQSKVQSLSYPKHFETFWSAYPKKVGKKAALRAWKAAKVENSLEIVLEALAKQKNTDQWCRENGRFIPNPATWLNQGRWEDETEDANSWQAEFLKETAG